MSRRLLLTLVDARLYITLQQGCFLWQSSAVLMIIKSGNGTPDILPWFTVKPANLHP